MWPDGTEAQIYFVCTLSLAVLSAFFLWAWMRAAAIARKYLNALRTITSADYWRSYYYRKQFSQLNTHREDES